MNSTGNSQTDAMKSLLSPRSIAIVGASEDESKLAGQIIPMLKGTGYAGSIFPVNPRYESVSGLVCYPSIADIPNPVDHAVLVIAKSRLESIIGDCAKAGVGSASIYSSGFAETGAAGQDAQRSLLALAGNMPFLGPNCMGFANLLDGIFATTAPVLLRHPEPGDVAFLSQSGGLAFASICYSATARGLRFSHVVNTGNTAGVNMGQLVEYVAAAEEVKVILLVIESEAVAGDVVRSIGAGHVGKPIVLLKLGRGVTGTAMAASHTGSLAGDYLILRDVMEQSGVTCVDDIDEAVDVVTLLRNGFTAAHASGLAALSISGGNVTLLADAMDRADVSFADLDARTLNALRAALPEYISIHNPIDITALGYERPELHGDVIKILGTDSAVRVITPILTTMEDYRLVAEVLIEAVSRSEGWKLAVVWNGGSYDGETREILAASNIPVFPTASALATALKHLAQVQYPEEKRPASQDYALADGEQTVNLSESASLSILDQLGVPTATWRKCEPNEVGQEAEAVGFPVVLKVDSSDTHISDHGAVVLGLRNTAEAIKAAHSLARDFPAEDLLVMQQLRGTEFIVSAFRHPVYGPLLMFGPGGQLVELVRDVRFLPLPVSRARLESALAGTVLGKAVLQGVRGMSGFSGLVDFLDVLGQGLCKDPQLVRAEINPVIVGEHGAAAVDSAVVYERVESSSAPGK